MTNTTLGRALNARNQSFRFGFRGAAALVALLGAAACDPQPVEISVNGAVRWTSQLGGDRLVLGASWA